MNASGRPASAFNHVIRPSSDCLIHCIQSTAQRRPCTCWWTRPWACSPISPVRTARTSAAATRTGTAGSAAICPGKPVSRISRRTSSTRSSRGSTTPPWNSSDTKRPTRYRTMRSPSYNQRQSTRRRALHLQIELERYIF